MKWNMSVMTALSVVVLSKAIRSHLHVSCSVSAFNKTQQEWADWKTWGWQDAAFFPLMWCVLPVYRRARAENPCPIFRAIFPALTFAGKTQRTPNYWVLDKWSLLYLWLSVFGIRGLTQTFYSTKKTCLDKRWGYFVVTHIYPWLSFTRYSMNPLFPLLLTTNKLPYYMTHLKVNYPNQLLKNIHNKSVSKFNFQAKLGLSAVFYAQCGHLTAEFF